MYHTLAHPTTIELTERNAPMKGLVRELCHKFNVFVMTHDLDLMAATTNNPIDDPVRQIRFEDRHLRLLLTRENGMPFCVTYIDHQEKDGKVVPCYNVISPMISKNKGRGSDRKSRESIHIKALMKSLEKDYDTGSRSLDLRYFLEHDVSAFPSICRSADSLAKIGWGNSISLGSDPTIGVLKYIFEDQPLSNEVRDKLKDEYNSYLKILSKKAMSKEISDRFVTDCYVVLRHYMTPAIVAKISFHKNINSVTGETNVDIKVHDGVKCYADMDALAADLPDLAVSIKMFSTKNQIKTNTNRECSLFPIATQLPNNEDKLDTDLDVYVENNGMSGFSNFGHYDLLITPVTNNGQ